MRPFIVNSPFLWWVDRVFGQQGASEFIGVMELATGMSDIDIEPFRDSRSELLPLFAQADDSPAEIAAYIERGDVFVARRAGRIVGHVQFIASGAEWEIKSVAVLEEQRRRGIGAALVRAAVARACSAGAARVVVSAATADIDNLRFYQRLGFRMDRIERDAFNAERGYPSLEIDRIPLRDRVWFSIDAGARPADAQAHPQGGRNSVG